MPSKRRKIRSGSAALILLAAGLAACSGSSTNSSKPSNSGTNSSGHSTSGSLTIATVTAFTGPQAFFGTNNQVACNVATKVVNDAGGVLGHNLTCKAVDDKGDPADAVPAVNNLLATTNHIALINGLGAETPSVMPLFNAAKIPAIALLGDPIYNRNKSPYFFRLIASDTLGGTALGYFAATHGYRRAAAVFTSDSGAQTSAAPAVAAYKKAGGTLVSNLTLQSGSTDYRTEAAALVNAHPDAIITEMDRATAITFLQEVAQLNGGRVPPVLGTETFTRGTLLQTLVKDIGPRVITEFRTVEQAQAARNPANEAFNSTIQSLGSKIRNPSQYATDYYTQSLYDGIILASLAMLQAHSTSAPSWAPLITKLTNGSPGAVTVSTFAQGKAALAAGKQIRYVGAIGPITLDQYHNSRAPFVVERFTPGTYKPVVVGHIPPNALANVG